MRSCRCQEMSSPEDARLAFPLGAWVGRESKPPAVLLASCQVCFSRTDMILQSHSCHFFPLTEPKVESVLQAQGFFGSELFCSDLSTIHSILHCLHLSPFVTFVLQLVAAEKTPASTTLRYVWARTETTCRQFK